MDRKTSIAITFGLTLVAVLATRDTLAEPTFFDAANALATQRMASQDKTLVTVGAGSSEFEAVLNALGELAASAGDRQAELDKKAGAEAPDFDGGDFSLESSTESVLILPTVRIKYRIEHGKGDILFAARLQVYKGTTLLVEKSAIERGGKTEDYRETCSVKPDTPEAEAIIGQLVQDGLGKLASSMEQQDDGSASHTVVIELPVSQIKWASTSEL